MPAAPPRRSRHTPGRLRAILAAVVVMGAGLVAAPAQAAEKGVVPDMTWGVTPADQDRTAAALKDTGTQWVRLNMSWYWLDAYPGYWEKYDRAVRLARESGAKIVMMFNHSPQWASGSLNIDAPPLLPELYGDALRDLVEHYRGQVDAYEIWNEPNHPQFWPTLSGPSAEAYVPLLKAGARAVRQADPAAKVVFGGLAHNDYEFLEAAYAVEPDLGDHFDVMAVHPYATPFDEAPDTVKLAADGRVSKGSFTGYREVHDVLEDHGDHKPMWFTEFGWSSATTGGGVGELKQAEYMTRAFEMIESDPYVEAALVYNFRNHYWAADANNWLDSLGLMRVDYTPKPAYHAYKAYQPPVPAVPEAPVVTSEPTAPAPPSSEPAAPAETVPAPADALAADAPEVGVLPAPPTSGPAGAVQHQPSTRISVRIRPTGSARARSSKSILRAGRRAGISGRVTGARGGRVSVRLVVRGRDGRWRQARELRLPVSRSGAFRTTVQLGRPAQWRLVVRYAHPGSDASIGRSIPFRVRRG